jgi:hypothetical protein
VQFVGHELSLRRLQRIVIGVLDDVGTQPPAAT